MSSFKKKHAKNSRLALASPKKSAIHQPLAQLLNPQKLFSQLISPHNGTVSLSKKGSVNNFKYSSRAWCYTIWFTIQYSQLPMIPLEGSR